jgi:hypothetical protein
MMDDKQHVVQPEPGIVATDDIPVPNVLEQMQHVSTVM